MDTDRFDELLDAALESGRVPVDASPAERAELEEMLAATGSLRTAGETAASEARASMPIARARFERFIASERAAALPAPAMLVTSPKRGFFSRILVAHRSLSLAAMAVIALVVVGGLVGNQVLFQGVETAAALVPGDYAQVQGVVTSVSNENGKQTVHVDSGLGGIDIDISDSTSVVYEENASDLSAVKPGATVLVGGLVVNNRLIAARTLALSSAASAATAPRLLKFKELKELKDGLQGHVVTFSLAPDGVRARVLVETDSGESFLVIVDGRSAERLLKLERSLGVKVSVTALVAGVFSLQVTDQGAPPPPVTRPAGVGGTVTPPGAQAAPASPSLLKVNGIITARDGNVFSVQTRNGPASIVVTADTRIFLGESGLTIIAVRNGDSAIGHSVQVQGGIERASGKIRADTVVVGPKLTR